MTREKKKKKIGVSTKTFFTLNKIQKKKARGGLYGAFVSKGLIK